MIVPITDHFEQAADKLIQRYKGKPRFAALLGTYIKQVQELEDATWQVVASRDVDTADDVRLEILGRLVSQPRRGATTEQYRLYIKSKIAVNRSDGAPETLKSIARLLLGQGTTLTEYPMWETFEVKGPIDPVIDDPGVVTELLRDAHTAGVGFAFIAQAAADGFLFGDDTLGGQVDARHGFSSEAATDGGFLAGIW